MCVSVVLLQQKLIYWQITYLLNCPVSDFMCHNHPVVLELLHGERQTLLMGTHFQLFIATALETYMTCMFYRRNLRCNTYRKWILYSWFRASWPYINKIQRDATVCRRLLLQSYSTRSGCLSHPSSGVHQTVTEASGTGHSVRATTFRQRGLQVALAEDTRNM